MTGIASRSQLRMSFLRWALVTVPLILLLGIAAGRVSDSRDGWFAALVKPEAMPPAWAFPVAWSILYVMMGFAVAMILHARGARGRGVALGLFGAQFLLNLGWSPLFFGAHKVDLALLVIVAMLALAIATTVAFGRIRKLAAWLLVPYLAWLCFASILNYQIAALNPDAETLAPGRGGADIQL